MKCHISTVDRFLNILLLLFCTRRRDCFGANEMFGSFVHFIVYLNLYQMKHIHTEKILDRCSSGLHAFFDLYQISIYTRELGLWLGYIIYVLTCLYIYLAVLVGYWHVTMNHSGYKVSPSTFHCFHLSVAYACLLL